MSTSLPNYVSIFCDGSSSWCYTLLHNCNCWNDTRPSMYHHHSFLMDDCTTQQLEINKKVGIFNIFCKLTWPRCDLDMTLVLSTSKAQLLLMLLFAHKLRSGWCLHTNLTLQNKNNFFQTPSPGIEQWGCMCAQEFSVKKVKIDLRRHH